jgi:D-serine deaminase-like pyridoxal phosphate-dependent protein
MDFRTLKTPSLLLDLARVRGNSERINTRIAALDVRLRPHIKTHKCLEVGRLQTAGHSGAITVSTLAEARAFIAGGFTDILYAVPIDPGKFAEAIDLSRRCEHFGVITDNLAVPAALNDAARAAGVTIGLHIKVDCGYHRVGVDPEAPESLELAKRISDATHLRFGGILTHAGHSYNAATSGGVREIARQERDVMVGFADKLRRAGLTVSVVSVGSTPTITHVDHLVGIDEARPGNYIFFDAFQATLGSCGFADCALTVLASVVHRNRARRKIVVDAGAIALSKDRGAIEIDPGCGYGHVLDLDGNDLGLRVGGMSQEHGMINDVDDRHFDNLPIGARVRILANHSCLTAAQYDHYNVLEGDRIIDRWEIHRGW